jgi:AcrR family transcriptional regulator
MRTKPDDGEGVRRSFTETARRAQIVDAAIETIAEIGYARTSFTQITKRAGLSSPGLISYHFAGKDELIAQVVTEVHAQIGEFMFRRMEGQSSAAEALRAYIQGVVQFIKSHRARMSALMEIFLNWRPEGGGGSYDATSERSVLEPLEGILRWGQESGMFRAFDTRVMATTIQRSIDGLPFALQADPGIDLDSYADELVTLFDRATRSM